MATIETIGAAEIYKVTSVTGSSGRHGHACSVIAAKLAWTS